MAEGGHQALLYAICGDVAHHCGNMSNRWASERIRSGMALCPSYRIAIISPFGAHGAAVGTTEKKRSVV